MISENIIHITQAEQDISIPVAEEIQTNKSRIKPIIVNSQPFNQNSITQVGIIEIALEENAIVMEPEIAPYILFNLPSSLSSTLKCSISKECNICIAFMICGAAMILSVIK